MRKLAVLFLTIILSTSSCFAWGWKKDSDTPKDKDFNNEGSGYVGTLPDISKQFSSNDAKKAKPLYEKTKNFNSSVELKPIPRDNPAFVNIILKPNKISPFINDMNELLPQLENLLLSVEKQENVQKFNAKVYFFTKTVDYLNSKYENTPESTFISFKKLLELRNHTQSVATLRAEAEKYRPYLAYTGAGYLYNDNVINQQLEYLKTEIENTIVLLKEIN